MTFSFIWVYQATRPGREGGRAQKVPLSLPLPRVAGLLYANEDGGEMCVSDCRSVCPISEMGRFGRRRHHRRAVQAGRKEVPSRE